MFPLNAIRQVWLAQHKVDFRKSFDGLLSEAFKLGLDPFEGDCVIFIGRRKKSIKVLFCDHTGIWILSKRFIAGTIKTKFKFQEELSCLKINSEEVSLLVQGCDYHVTKRLKNWPAAKNS